MPPRDSSRSHGRSSLAGSCVIEAGPRGISAASPARSARPRAVAVRGRVDGSPPHGRSSGLSGSSGSSEADCRPAPTLDEGEDGRQDEQRREGRGDQPADDGPAERGGLLAPLAPAQGHGTMPAIMAQLVIRIGRSRPCAPSTAAVPRSAAVLAAMPLGEGHQQDRVGDRHADRHDRPHERLEVDASSRSARGRRPRRQTTAGAVETATRASRTDWKFAVSRSRMTTIDIAEADAQARGASPRIGTICPRTSTVDPLGRAPRPARWPARRWPATRPRSSPAMFAVRLTDRFML